MLISKLAAGDVLGDGGKRVARFDFIFAENIRALGREVDCKIVTAHPWINRFQRIPHLIDIVLRRASTADDELAILFAGGDLTAGALRGRNDGRELIAQL